MTTAQPQILDKLITGAKIAHVPAQGGLPRMPNVFPFVTYTPSGENRQVELVQNQYTRPLGRRLAEPLLPVSRPSSSTAGFFMPQPLHAALPFTPSRDGRVDQEKTKAPPTAPSMPKDKISITEQTIQQLKKAIAQHEGQTTAQTNQRDLEKLKRAYQKNLFTVQQLNLELNQQIQRYQKQIQTYKQQFGQRSKEHEALEARVLELNQSSNQLRQLFEASQASLRNLKEQLSSRREELERIQKEKAAPAQKQSEIENQAKAARIIQSNLEKTLEQTKAEYQKKLEEKNQGEIQLLRREIDELYIKLIEQQKYVQQMNELKQRVQEELGEKEKLAQGLAAFKNQLTQVSQAKAAIEGNYQTEQKKLEGLQAQLAKSHSTNLQKEQELQAQKTRVQQLLTDKQKLSTFVNELNAKLNQLRIKEQRLEVPPDKKVVQAKLVPPISDQKPFKLLTRVPNVINGIAMDKKENPLIHALVMIKNSEGETVRALRTNKLAQFIAVTPLPDGKYRIETEKDDFKFDILEIELNGQIVAPILIQAQ